MTPTRAKVGDTVRIIVQGFQVRTPGVTEGYETGANFQSYTYTAINLHYVQLILFFLCNIYVAVSEVKKQWHILFLISAMVFVTTVSINSFVSSPFSVSATVFVTSV